jgi:NadR type nicotinamide-nucleotide adenylyltransferase
MGKFYPPHAGHHRLIRAAASECDEMVVLVVASCVESIPLTERIAWLADEHSGVRVLGVRCDAPLDVTDEVVWRAHVAAVQAALRHAGIDGVDVVYSGEAYGDELAARLGARHRPVGRDAVSASAVRADLAGRWDELAAATRAGLATRAVIVGAESTGTTTIAVALADHYRRRGGVWAPTECVLEYGREYTSLKWDASGVAMLDDLLWSHNDFDRVAHEQIRAEQDAARRGSPVLVCDTDAFATSIWERRYLGLQARTGQPWASPPQLPVHHVYFVTHHEGVPWQDDGMREGDLTLRAAMTGWFVDGLTAAGHSWVLLTGTPEERLALAVRTVDQVLERRMTFAPPFAGPGFGVAASAVDANASEIDNPGYGPFHT